MKKTLTIILALALVMSLSVPALAANQTEGRTDLIFTYIPAEPVYTVTIPGSLNLEIGMNFLPITISDAENLRDKTVVVTFEGTQEYSSSFDWYFLSLQSEVIDSSVYSIPYSIIGANGVELGNDPGNPGIATSGIALAEFTDNGTKQITAFIDEDDVYIDKLMNELHANTLFTGYIIFGIKLV